MRTFKNIISILGIAALLAGCGKDYVSPTNSGTNAGTSGSLARFAVSNNTLYTVTNATLTAYDVSDNTDPVYQSASYLTGNAETIFATPSFLYIGSQMGMSIYDVVNPMAPKYLGGYSHFRSCDPVVANAKYAFTSLRVSSTCTRGLNQLDVVDITDPTNPKLIKSYPMTEPYGLALDGNNLFLCDGGIKLYDISDVNNIVLKQKIVVSAKDVIAQNGKLMVVGNDGLYQYSYASGTMVQLSKISVK